MAYKFNPFTGQLDLVNDERTESIIVPLTAMGADAVVASDLLPLGRYFPFDFEVSDVILTVSGAPTGDNIWVDIKQNFGSIFSSLLQVDDSTFSSSDSVAPYTFFNSLLLKGSTVSFDILQVGSTTPGQGLVLVLFGKRR